MKYNNLASFMGNPVSLGKEIGQRKGEKEGKRICLRDSISVCCQKIPFHGRATGGDLIPKF